MNRELADSFCRLTWQNLLEKHFDFLFPVKPLASRPTTRLRLVRNSWLSTKKTWVKDSEKSKQWISELFTLPSDLGNTVPMYRSYQWPVSSSMRAANLGFGWFSVQPRVGCIPKATKTWARITQLREKWRKSVLFSISALSKRLIRNHSTISFAERNCDKKPGSHRTKYDSAAAPPPDAKMGAWAWWGLSPARHVRACYAPPSPRIVVIVTFYKTGRISFWLFLLVDPLPSFLSRVPYSHFQKWLPRLQTILLRTCSWSRSRALMSMKKQMLRSLKIFPLTTHYKRRGCWEKSIGIWFRSYLCYTSSLSSSKLP